MFILDTLLRSYSRTEEFGNSFLERQQWLVSVMPSTRLYGATTLSEGGERKPEAMVSAFAEIIEKLGKPDLDVHGLMDDLSTDRRPFTYKDKKYAEWDALEKEVYIELLQAGGTLSEIDGHLLRKHAFKRMFESLMGVLTLVMRSGRMSDAEVARIRDSLSLQEYVDASACPELFVVLVDAITSLPWEDEVPDSEALGDDVFRRCWDCFAAQLDAEFVSGLEGYFGVRDDPKGFPLDSEDFPLFDLDTAGMKWWDEEFRVWHLVMSMIAVLEGSLEEVTTENLEMLASSEYSLLIKDDGGRGAPFVPGYIPAYYACALEEEDSLLASATYLTGLEADHLLDYIEDFRPKDSGVPAGDW